MKNICNCEDLKRIKVEADIGADPIWCAVCHYNVELDVFPISDSLKQDFHDWVSRFGEWLDWETDTLTTDGKVKEKQHNSEGEFLTKRLKQELGETYEIEFIASKMYETYE